MKTLIPLLLCGVFGACASPDSKEAAPASVEQVEDSLQVSSLPEVRYYEISEA